MMQTSDVKITSSHHPTSSLRAKRTQPRANRPSRRFSFPQEYKQKHRTAIIYTSKPLPEPTSGRQAAMTTKEGRQGHQMATPVKITRRNPQDAKLNQTATAAAHSHRNRKRATSQAQRGRKERGRDSNVAATRALTPSRRATKGRGRGAQGGSKAREEC